MEGGGAEIDGGGGGGGEQCPSIKSCFARPPAAQPGSCQDTACVRVSPVVQSAASWAPDICTYQPLRTHLATNVPGGEYAHWL